MFSALLVVFTLLAVLFQPSIPLEVEFQTNGEPALLSLSDAQSCQDCLLQQRVWVECPHTLSEAKGPSLSIPLCFEQSAFQGFQRTDIALDCIFYNRSCEEAVACIATIREFPEGFEEVSQQIAHNFTWVVFLGAMVVASLLLAITACKSSRQSLQLDSYLANITTAGTDDDTPAGVFSSFSLSNMQENSAFDVHDFGE